jgi:L-2-hydroxyglutarate oxidase LhgO
MPVDFDTIVVGAGVIGLAIARQLAMGGQSVLVLEKASRAGTETSSRNSEVIHAGIYFPTGSLKTRMCVKGRELLYDFCDTHGVANKRLGKLIVATTAEEEAKLHAIAALAKANGVDDLAWLSQADVAQLEPDVRCTRALFSPSTGIVDASAYVLALQGDAESLGAIFAFNTSFQTAHKRNDAFVVNATDSGGESSELTSHALINCAGHGAHDVVKTIVGYPSEICPPRYLAKGSYCSVSGKSPFRHLVYPVPVSGALGIHATLDLAGAVRFGPDIQWIDALDYTMPRDLPEKFAAAVEPYWPQVRDRTLTPSYCGIRPKIHGPHESFADFAVQQQEEHGVPGLTTLFGIESPGLTASLAIAMLIGRHSFGETLRSGF